jgi:hypothetical protein
MVFSPGQVLEKQLGIDFSTRVDRRTALFKRLFGMVPGAAGISATQGTAVGVPVSPATRRLNLFLQYKRPEYFAPQHHKRHLWPRNQSFLRFTVSEPLPAGGHHFSQIKAMISLQAKFGSSALVRYVCPSFWTKEGLYDAFHRGTLLSTSAFVDPQNLLGPVGPDPFHRRWTFQASLPGSGKPNPTGSRLDAEDGESFFANAEQRASLRTSTDGYLADLRRQATEIRDMKPIIEAARARKTAAKRRADDAEDTAVEKDLLSFDSGDQEAVRDSLEIASVSRDVGLAWSILEFE